MKYCVLVFSAVLMLAGHGIAQGAGVRLEMSVYPAITGPINPCPPAKAVVIRGNMSWSFGTKEETVARAKNRCIGKGYQTTVVHGTNDQVAKAAIDSETRVVVLIGHGAYLNGEYDCGVQMENGSSFFGPATFGAQETFPDVRDLVLLSCGQLDPQVRGQWWEIFPNADLHGFPGWTNFSSVKAYAKRFAISFACTASASLGPTWSAYVELDPTLHPQPPSVFNEGFEVGNWATPTNPAFVLDPITAMAFGERVFNLELDFEDELGIQADMGVVKAWVSGGYASPDFTLVLPEWAWRLALDDPPILDALYDSGAVTVEGNATGLSDDTLYEGASGLLFGI